MSRFLGLFYFAIVIHLIFANISLGTIQQQETLYMDSIKCRFQKASGEISPFSQLLRENRLNHVFNKSSLNTGLYRGFVGIWEFRKDTLGLKGISVDGIFIPTNSFFITGTGNSFLPATWFSDSVSITCDDKNYNTVYLSKGVISSFISKKDSKTNKVTIPRRLFKMRIELAYLQRNIRDSIEINNQISQRTSAIEKLTSGVYGFPLFSFLVEISDATVGMINSFPKSLHYNIKPRYTKMIKSSWLWMPIEGEHLKNDFYAFLGYLYQVDRHLQKFSSLKKWVASNNLIIELQVFGNEPAISIFDREYSVNPVQKYFPDYKIDFYIWIRDGSNVVARLVGDFDKNEIVVVEKKRIRSGGFGFDMATFSIRNLTSKDDVSIIYMDSIKHNGFSIIGIN